MEMRWWFCVCSLGILLLVPCTLSEKFSLHGSPHPMVGIMGQDVVLPCQLSPQARLANMEVWWRKYSTAFILVHEYSDQGPKDQPGDGYQSRTELFSQEFSNGNVSLKLKRLQEADAGRYHCFVRDPDWSQEVTTELRIAAVAPVFIDVLGPQGQGIGLACKTTGWFPKPQVQWVGKNQQNLATEIVTDVTQGRGNLYSVVSHITVTEGEDTGHIICIVRNGILDMEQQSAIHLSGDIFPRASPWLAAFWALFILVLVAAGACAYLGYRAKQKQPTKEEAAFINESDKKTFEAECLELREKLESMSQIYESERQDLNEKLETAEKMNQDLKPETAAQKIQGLISECQKLNKEHETAVQKFQDLKSECQKLQKEFETAEKEVRSLKSECQKLPKKLGTVMKKIQDLNSGSQELNEKLGTAAQKIQGLISEFPKLHKEHETMAQKSQDLNSVVETLRKELGFWKKNKPEEKECRELLNMLETLQNKNKHLESECQQLHQKLAFEEKTKELESADKVPQPAPARQGP